ncbi:hypothetical protein BC937DRAFT_86939, partial [Endogone sp. FLAS-F59071]
MDNAKIRRRNIYAANDDSLLVAFTPMVKQIAEGIFPANLNDLNNFDHDHLLLLMAFYNETFGILAEDPLRIRCLKAMKWMGITGQP